MSVGTYFSSAAPSLSQLSAAVLADISEIVFCCRGGIETTCIVTYNLSTLTTLMGTVPDVLQSAVTGRYFLDIDSLNTSVVRTYVDSPNPNEVILNYNFDASNNLVQKKIYKRVFLADGTLDPYNLLIDRYDGAGNLVSANEPEAQTDRDSWTGSSSLADAAEASPYRVRWMSKGNTPQSYIYVLP